MPSRLRHIIHELAQTSAAANVISTRLLVSLSEGNVDSNLVESLRQEILRLNQQILILQSPESKEDAVYTEEELSMFRSSFEYSLSQLTVPFINKFYSSEYFLDKPKNVRLVIATSLVNDCARRNLEPNDVWLKIIATNGAL